LQLQIEDTHSKGAELQRSRQLSESLQAELDTQKQELEDSRMALKQMANSQKHVSIELEEAQCRIGHLEIAQRSYSERERCLQDQLHASSRDLEVARAALQSVTEDKEELDCKLLQSQEKVSNMEAALRDHEAKSKQNEERMQKESETAVKSIAADRDQLQRQLKDAHELLRGRDVVIADKDQREAELADVLAQKELLETQLAATVVRLDEEQAERIRQGARAETLEKDLLLEQKQRSEKVVFFKAQLAEQSWRHLATGASWHLQHRMCQDSLRDLAVCRQEVLRREREREVQQEQAEMPQQLPKDLLADLHPKHTEDLVACMTENEELRVRNRELAMSMQHFKQENEQLHVHNKSLLESAALFEGDLERVSDRHAQLIGHVNKKQKIRYTVKLKEECAQLRLDLNRARHRLMQLEGSRRSDSLYGALASLGYATPAIENSPQPKRRASQDQSLQSPGSPPLIRDSSRVSPHQPGARAAIQLDEAHRRLRLQDCALERVNSDFRHLVILVQGIIGCEKGDETASFADLLQRLRNIMKLQGSQGAGVENDCPSTPRARHGPASPLNLSRTSPSASSEVKAEVAVLDQDKENKENVGKNHAAELDNKADSHDVVGKVIKQINFALSFGARKLYGRPIQDVRSFFQALDRNGSGVVERKDIAQGFKRLDIVLQNSALEQLVKLVGQEAGGYISLSALIKMLEGTGNGEMTTTKLQPLPRGRP